MKVEIISVDPHNSTQLSVYVKLPDYDIFTEIITGHTLTISEGVRQEELLEALQSDEHALSQMVGSRIWNDKDDAWLQRLKAAIAELKKELA